MFLTMPLLTAAAAYATDDVPEEDAATQSTAVHRPADITTTWSCYLSGDGSYQGTVAIWWGHRQEDAQWACNNWIPNCGNNGGCFAVQMPNDPGCGPWNTGTITGYNNSSSDDPNAGSVVDFTGLTDNFYNNVPIAAVDSSDWERDKYHWVEITFNGRTQRVGVWDECRNEDCPDGTDCCTKNKTMFASPGYLLDLETRTASRLFGVSDAEDTLLAPIQYRVCEAFDPDPIAARYGAHR